MSAGELSVRKNHEVAIRAFAEIEEAGARYQIVGFSANIITRIKRDDYISLDTIEKICKTLDCGVDEGHWGQTL